MRGLAGSDLETSLLSFEKLDRASPDLWPEQRKCRGSVAGGAGAGPPRPAPGPAWPSRRAGPVRGGGLSGAGRTALCCFLCMGETAATCTVVRRGDRCLLAPVITADHVSCSRLFLFLEGGSGFSCLSV